MVLKELLGPGSAEEEIIESPGTRYFVGVLAPRKRAKARCSACHSLPSCQPPTADDEEEDADGEILDGDELALGGRGHHPGRHDRSGPGAGQGPDPVVVRHDLLASTWKPRNCNCRRPGASTSRRPANTSSAKRPATPGGSGSGIPEAASIA